MLRSTKTAVVTISAVLLTLCLAGYFGFREFVRAIYRQRGCDWANIDNIEVHAAIDIPAITYSDCMYDPDRNVKRAFFNIDTGEVNMDRYIRVNGLIKHTTASGFGLDGFLKNRHTPDLEHLPGLYFRSGRHKRERWKALLDKQSGRLWITLWYGD